MSIFDSLSLEDILELEEELNKRKLELLGNTWEIENKEINKYHLENNKDKVDYKVKDLFIEKDLKFTNQSLNSLLSNSKYLNGNYKDDISSVLESATNDLLYFSLQKYDKLMSLDIEQFSDYLNPFSILRFDFTESYGGFLNSNYLLEFYILNMYENDLKDLINTINNDYVYPNKKLTPFEKDLSIMLETLLKYRNLEDIRFENVVSRLSYNLDPKIEDIFDNLKSNGYLSIFTGTLPINENTAQFYDDFGGRLNFILNSICSEKTNNKVYNFDTIIEGVFKGSYYSLDLVRRYNIRSLINYYKDIRNRLFKNKHGLLHYGFEKMDDGDFKLEGHTINTGKENIVNIPEFLKNVSNEFNLKYLRVENYGFILSKSSSSEKIEIEEYLLNPFYYQMQRLPR